MARNGKDWVLFKRASTDLKVSVQRNIAAREARKLSSLIFLLAGVLLLAMEWAARYKGFVLSLGIA